MMRIALLLILVTPLETLAQSQGCYDTLTLARRWMGEKKIKESILILEVCEKAHPGNIDVIRLLGQALYWSKDFDKTVRYFRKAIQENPEIMVLKMDFGRILFDMNLLIEAKDLITEYYKAEPADVEAQLILATIAYWLGKRPREAFRYLNPVLARYPTNARALALDNEIHQATSPWIKINPGYYADSQPLKVSALAGEAGFYQSSLLQPNLQLQVRSLDDGYINHQAETFQLANNFAFLKMKSKALVKAGLFNSSWTDHISMTGGLELHQKISKTVTLSASADHSPYFSTIRSLYANVMQTNYSAAVDHERVNGWNGKAVYNVQQFADNNQVKSFSVWFLLPVVNSSSFKFDLGYAYHVANSKRNTFVNDKALGEIIAIYYPGYTITGVYDPYFTPQNQNIHSLLGNIGLQSRSFKFSIKSNAGFYGAVDNPYFYLNYNKDQQLTLEKGYSRLNYFPLEIKSSVGWSLSKNVLLEAEYMHRKTFFYTSNSVSANLQINFWNEKKR